MVAAAVSLTCPLRRSSRLAHAHSHTHSPPPLRQSHKLKQQHLHHHHHRHHTRPVPDPEPDQDSSSSDPENELTPRALRALKRQRLALDVDGLPLAARVRPRKRRKENFVQTTGDDTRPSQLQIKDAVERPKRPSTPALSPLALKRPHSVDNTTTGHNVTQFPSTLSISVPEPTTDSSNEAGLSSSMLPSTTFNEPSLATAFNDEPSILSPKDHDPHFPSMQVTKKPVLSIPIPAISIDFEMAPPPSRVHTPTSPEPLTPLTPLTPTSESSPSLPGHERQTTPPPPPPDDPLPPPISLESLPNQYSPIPDVSSRSNTPSQPLALDFTPSPSAPSSPLSLDPALETLIPFEGIPPQFVPEIPLHLPPPPPSQPLNSPQLPGMEQEPSPAFQQSSQLYVPPNPVFVRDREINIWKLACQERVDCLLRRYGPDYIKALVQSEARSLFKDTQSSASSYADQVAAASEFNASLSSTPSPTKFRLYTPASYTYTSNSWGSGSGVASGRKEFPVDGDGEDGGTGWAMDDGEWGDGDVDMEDDDEDDYEDDDDVDGEGEGELSLGAVEGLRIGDAAFGVVEDKVKVDARVNASMDVDEQIAAKQTQGQRTAVQGLPGTPPPEATLACEVPMSSAPTVSHPDSSPRPLPIRNPYTPSPPPTHLQRPSLPPLSSLHVPLLSEPPRAFMGRGTPPDRRRLVEWSGFGRFGSHRLGMGPPLYLSPVPQRHTNADVGVDVGIVPMSVDAPMHPPTPLPEHAHQGEWTSFLYAMLEGDGVGVGVSVGGASQGSEPGWYELGLGSVPATVPSNDLGISLSHSHSPAPTVEHTVDEGNSSSTLRFALG